MVDLTGAHGAITASDFIFKMPSMTPGWKASRASAGLRAGRSCEASLGYRAETPGHRNLSLARLLTVENSLLLSCLSYTADKV
jgi:hypothetical protein